MSDSRDQDRGFSVRWDPITHSLRLVFPGPPRWSSPDPALVHRELAAAVYPFLRTQYAQGVSEQIAAAALTRALNGLEARGLLHLIPPAYPQHTDSNQRNRPAEDTETKGKNELGD